MARHVLALAMTPLLLSPVLAQSQKVGDPPEAMNMRLVGMSDLQARSAYQPTIHRQGERIIAYIGHHGGTPDVPKPINKMTGQAEFNGTSILDVTDPANPKYLKHIPGLEGNYEEGGAQMVRVCDGKGLPKGDPAKTYMLRVFGGRAHQIWDVTEPANAVMLAQLESGRDTHKNWWECDTGIAYLVSGIPGWRTRRMMQVYDLSDPAHPKHIRDFGLVGQQPGTEGAVPTELHGAISSGPQGGRIYVGYGTNKGGVLQILDREKLVNGPKEPTPENLRAPVIGELQMSPLVGAHTTYPLGKIRIPEFANDKFGAERNMVMIVDEALVNECGAGESRQMVWFVDATIEKQPMVVASYTPAAGNFCERGGRFGAHSSNESMAPVFRGKLAFVTFFNAGVRAIDIRNPYRPREVASFIPPITEATDKRCIRGSNPPQCKVAIQTNNVETDDRGYIYIVDRANTGMHILELTGEARAIAGR